MEIHDIEMWSLYRASKDIFYTVPSQKGTVSLMPLIITKTADLHYEKSWQQSSYSSCVKSPIFLSSSLPERSFDLHFLTRVHSYTRPLTSVGTYALAFSRTNKTQTPFTPTGQPSVFGIIFQHLTMKTEQNCLQATPFNIFHSASF